MDERKPQDKALANIAACRDALKAFLPIASPDLMRELTDAVDRYEDQVREFNGLSRPKKFATRLTDKGSVCNKCDRWVNVAYDRFCSNCGAPIA